MHVKALVCEYVNTRQLKPYIERYLVRVDHIVAKRDERVPDIVSYVKLMGYMKSENIKEKTCAAS